MEDQKRIIVKSRLLILFFLSLSGTISQAQEIEVKKVWGGYRFIKNEKSLSNRELIATMQAHPSALVLMKKARSIDRTASPIVAFGAVAFGFWGADLIQGNGFKLGTFGISVGLYTIGFHLHAKSDKKAIQAINLFNGDLSHLRQQTPELKLVAKGNGLGFVLSF